MIFIVLDVASFKSLSAQETIVWISWTYSGWVYAYTEYFGSGANKTSNSKDNSNLPKVYNLSYILIEYIIVVYNWNYCEKRGSKNGTKHMKGWLWENIL